MLYFFLTLFFFSTLEIASKPLMGLLDPFFLTLIRFSIGLITILFFMFLSGQGKSFFKLTRKQIITLGLLGVLNVFFSMSMLQLAVKTSSASTAAVVFCSNPLFVLMFSIFNGEAKASIKNIVPILLGIAGVVFVKVDNGLNLDHGVIYALLASVSFAFYTVLNKKILKKTNPMTTNAVSFLFGVIALFLFILLSGRINNDSITNIKNFDLGSILTILYLGVFVSGLGYFTFFKTLQKYSAVSSSYIFLLKPSIATILAIILLGERVGLNFWVGMLMIVSGGIMILRTRKKAG